MSQHDLLPSLIYFGSRYPMLPIRWVAETFLLHNAECMQHDGFTLYETTGRHQAHERLVQLHRGLRLIEKLDPVRYARMRIDMPKIAVADRGGARYWYATGTGVVDHSLVNERSAATIAVMLVNVAVRARVMKSPLARRLSPTALRRVARLAVKSQVAFARKLPSSDHPGVDKLLEYLHQQLVSHS